MKTSARFTYSHVDYTQDKDVHLVVDLAAPKVDWQAKRPSVCVLPCIDVSGSMSGQKLEYAKQSVLKLIDHLQPGDFCGLVTFESHVYSISPPMEMTQTRKDELKIKVGNLVPMGGTNFSGGLLEGLGHVNRLDLPTGMLIRVLMLTDGQANEGVATTRDPLIHILKQNLGKATLSAFGYGQDANQDLLADLAKEGKGNYAFIKNPDDALSAFAKELGGLLSTYAQNIQIDVRPHDGHSIEEVISDVDSTGDKTGVLVKIPDILGEEVRHLVFAVKVGKQPNAFPRASSVVDVKITYECLDDKGKRTTHTEELKGKLKFVKPGEEDKEPVKEVMELVGTAILVQKQLEAEELAKRGDYRGAQGVMRGVGAVLDFFQLHDHVVASSAISGKMENAAVYASNSGYLNSFSGGGTRSVGVSSYDPDAEGLLRGLGVSTTTSAQDAAVSHFVNVGDLTPAAAQQAIQGVNATHNTVSIGNGILAVGGGPSVPVGAGVIGLSGTAAMPAQPIVPPKSVTKNKSKRW